MSRRACSALLPPCSLRLRTLTLGHGRPTESCSHLLSNDARPSPPLRKARLVATSLPSETQHLRTLPSIGNQQLRTVEPPKSQQLSTPGSIDTRQLAALRCVKNQQLWAHPSTGNHQGRTLHSWAHHFFPRQEQPPRSRQVHRRYAQAATSASEASDYEAFEAGASRFSQEDEPSRAPVPHGTGKQRRGRRGGGSSTVKGAVVRAQSAGFGKAPLALPATLEGAVRRLLEEKKPKHIQHQVLRLCQALNSGRSEPLLPPGTQSLREPYIHDSLADSLAGAPAWLSTLPPSDTTPGSNSWGASLLLQQQEHQQFALPGRGKGRRRQEGGDEGEAGEQWRSGDAAVIGYGEMEALAYVCSRMPSCYGATARVLSEVSLQLPHFKPKTLFDFGAGPSTALWSACSVFGGGAFTKVVAIEPSEYMNHLGGMLLEEARLAASESRYAGEEAGGSERTSTMQEVGEEDDAGGEEGDDWERGMTMGQEEEREEEENEEEEEEGAEVKGTITVAPEPLWWPQVPSLQRFCNLDIASRHLRGAERHLDLVMAAYSIGELGSEQQMRSTVRRLWAHTKELLVIVEPGTPKGYGAVMLARNEILRMERSKERRSERKARSQTGKGPSFSVDIKEGKCPEDPSASHTWGLTPVESVPTLPRGAHVVAPCPHDKRCPVEGTMTWCHFEQRVKRLHVQRVTKRMPGDPVGRPIEQEKFAYVVLRRGPRQPGSAPRDTRTYSIESTDWTGDSVADGMAMEYEGWDRVTREPRRRGRHVLLDVCQALRGDAKAGVVQHVLSKGKSHEAHRCAKRTHWGDLWYAEKDVT